MKSIIYLIFLLNIKLYCQSGEIKYSVRFETDGIKEPKIEFQQKIAKINNNINLQKFQLNFNKQISVFKNITNILNNNNTSNREDKIASILTSAGNIYYNNINSKFISQKENGILIEEILDVKSWITSKEMKRIDNYDCYKAIKNTEFVDRKGERKIKTIIAWFAPSLPYNFGPKHYAGLPGLILELNESDKIKYFVTSIKITKNKTDIKLPKGKTITKEDYDKKLKDQMGM